MTNNCKFCDKEIVRGIFVSPQFPNEKTWLFCNETCKRKFLKMKIKRINLEYPKYFEKIKSGKDKYWNNVLGSEKGCEGSEKIFEEVINEYGGEEL
jgi:hypothetical protein